MPEPGAPVASATDSPEPGRIAIIGMSIRVPGAERDLDRFWDNLVRGVDVIRFFERQELLDQGVPTELVGRPDFVPARAVIRDADCFDGRLFGYSPQDSTLIDPQQRVLLECSWGALEHAGYSPIASDGNRVGVFVGTGTNVYLLDNLWPNQRILESAGGLQVMIASDRDFAATRIGYKLNLEGPALTLQTACSTSLVAIHLAAVSLLTYDTDMALAGAATIFPPTRRGYLHEPGGIFSPDGHCRTFDRQAEGTVPADGAGIVVLKRFEDAVRDRDTIHAVIAGSAINNDGARKAGFTAPGPVGQAEVISLALGVAGFDPDTIGFIETHGTGTALGDPIEVAALRQVFGPARDDRAPCALGALKSVMGHLDTAAGVVGVIKTVLALKHRTIPPVAHFTEPNPALKLEDSVFHVPTVAEPWASIGGTRRAGVSSFGIGGTNAHVVLEEAAPPPVGSPGRAAQLILVSAKTAPAATESLNRVMGHLADADGREHADIAFTLRRGRAGLPWRAAFISGPADQATAPRPPVQATNRARSRGVVFVVTGDGNQASYDADPVHCGVIDLGAARLQAIAAHLDDAGRERASRYLAATALAEALQSRGLEPTASVGRGIGAVAAACAAGVLTLTDGLDLVTGMARSARVEARPPRYALFTTSDGSRLTVEQARDPGYWVSVLDDPAADWVTGKVADLDPVAWLEIGTSTTLHLPSGTAPPAPADPLARLLFAVGVLWEMGIGGVWDEIHDLDRGRVPAPAYPFTATRHYIDAQAATSAERQI
jgi:phthiocerol/phenolphthiocerol synthesis type-I polyketide synthase E